MGNRGTLALLLLLALGGAGWFLAHGGRQAGRQATLAGQAEETSPVVTRPSAEPAVTAAPAIEREPAQSEACLDDDGEPRAWLLVRCVAREDGRPLAGIGFVLAPASLVESRAGLAPLETLFPGALDGTQRTDAEGRIELEVEPGMELALLVTRTELPVGLEPTRVPALAEGERRELELEFLTRDDHPWFGLVLDDESGAPLAGASAEWARAASLGAQGGNSRAVAGADGLLALEFASWKVTLATITSPGTFPEEVELESGHETPERALPIRMARVARLEVRVRDDLGAPLVGVPVEVVWGVSAEVAAVAARMGTALSRGVRRSDTDGGGSCAIEGLPPRAELSVVIRPGIGRSQRQSTRLEPGESRAVEFTVGRGCRLEGLAQDEGGEPLAGLDLWRLAAVGASATLRPEDEEAVVDKVRTDARGRFVFEAVSAGDWWIGPAPYHGRAGLLPRATRVTIEPGETRHAFTLVCPSARYLSGRVLSSSGVPARAEVTAERGNLRASGRSDEGGRFFVGPLDAGAWRVQARSGSGSDAPSEIQRAEAGRSDLVLRLRAGGRVFGNVRDELGRPAPGAEVRLFGEGAEDSYGTVADERGAFVLDGVEPGTYPLRASTAGAVGTLELVPVRGDGPTGPLDLFLAPGAKLTLALAREAAGGLVRVSVGGSTLALEPLEPGAERRVLLPPGTALVRLLVRTEADELEVREEHRVELRLGESAGLRLGEAARGTGAR